MKSFLKNRLLRQLGKMSKQGVVKKFDHEPTESLFAKMIKGDIKTSRVYEDEHTLVIKGTLHID
jgi:hypothetical protein